jgi:hypothetical protein
LKLLYSKRAAVYLCGIFIIFVGVSLFSSAKGFADDWSGRGDFVGFFSDKTLPNEAAPPFNSGICPYSARSANNCKGTDNGENYVLPADTDSGCGGSGDALPTQCVDNVTQFIALMKQDNASSDPRLHASSGFIVLTMLGETGDDAGTNGRTVSAAQWTDLQNRIQEESDKGLIKWNEYTTSAVRSFSVFLTAGARGDVVHYNSASDPQAGYAIDFYNSSGTLIYELFRVCANPGGAVNGLPAYTASTPPATWKLTGTTSVTPSSVVPGEAVAFTNKVTNTGVSTASFSSNIDYTFPTNNDWQIRTGLIAYSLAPRATLSYPLNEVTIPATAVNGEVYCERVYFTNASGPDTTAGTSTEACVTIVVPPTCGNATDAPTEIQAGDTFMETVNLGYNGSLPTYTVLKVSIPDPTINYSNNDATPIVITPTNMSFTTPALDAGQAGTYVVNWQLFNGTAPVSTLCTGLIKVISLPYFSVYGADVSSGGSFTDCTDTGGTLAGWYDSTKQAGSSTLLAALALGKINGFASGQNTVTGLPTGSASGLTFANTTAGGGASPSVEYGGNYNGDHCIYTPTTPAGTGTDLTSPAQIGVGNLLTKSHLFNGNLTLHGGAVATKNNLSVFVNGNVYITSNVVYGTDGGGAWTINTNDTTDVPSFTLVVTGGNIYIDHSVTELDGMYVAEVANGHGGTIYTCTAGFAPTAAPDLYTSCSNQLTVYGSFIADQINLMRTFGTLKNAQSAENPRTGTTRTCANGTAKKVCAAEIFDFSPEMNLSTPAIQPPSNGATSYDSITSLPPVL